MTRWRRWTVLVGLYLGLGALSSIVVAMFIWGSNLHNWSPGTAPRPKFVGLDAWPVRIDGWPKVEELEKWPGGSRIGATVRSGDGVTLWVMLGLVENDVYSITEWQVGWPFRCMKSISVSPAGATRVLGIPVDLPSSEALARAQIWTNRFDDGRALQIPLIPLPLGLLGNAVLYGAVLAVIRAIAFAVVWAVSALFRGVPEGLCPKCRYPRGTSPVCTECGEKLSA